MSASVLAADNPGVLVPGGRATARTTYGLAKSGWTVLGATGAEALIDDNPGTSWRAPAGVREVCLDLGESVRIGALSYLPPLISRSSDGFVQLCRWYVSATPDGWGRPVGELRCDNVVNNPVEQRLDVTPVTGRYVRIELLDTVNNAPQAAFGGLNVYRSTP